MGNVAGDALSPCNASCIEPESDELSLPRADLANIEEADLRDDLRDRWGQKLHYDPGPGDEGREVTKVPELNLSQPIEPPGNMAMGNKTSIVKGAHVIVVQSFTTAGKGNNIELKPGAWGKVSKVDPRDGQALIDFPGHRYNAYWVSPCDFSKMHAQAPTPRFGFDLTKLDASLRAAIEEEGRSEVTFLVMGGDFSPVHSEQINGFELAKQFLEEQGHCVVIGILGVSDDPSDGPRELAGAHLTREHRMAMCRVAAAGTTWLQEVSWGWAELEELRNDIESRILVLAKRTASRVQIGSDVKVTGYLLLGATFFCSLPQGSRDALHHAVILSHTSQHDETVQQLGSQGATREVHVVAGCRDVSAASLRSQINAGAWDELRATEDLPQGVAAFLDRNFGRRRRKAEQSMPASE